MGHVNPVIWIPMGSVLAILFAWVALTPNTVPRYDYDVRLLDRLIGETATNVVIRVFGAGMAVGAAWYAAHGVLAVVAG